jgi:hypothetical protein
MASAQHEVGRTVRRIASLAALTLAVGCGRLAFEPVASGDSGVGGRDTGTDGGGDPTGSLIGHWRLDETGLAAVAIDSAGTNDGTLTNFPTDPSANWIAGGQVGGALDFDGIDDTVLVGDTTALDNLAALTAAVWIRPDSMGQNTRGAVVNHAAGGDAIPALGWTLRLTSTNSLVFAADCDVDLFVRSIDNSVAIGSWQHVVVTWTGGLNASDVVVYIGGAAVAYDTSGGGGTVREDDSGATLRFGETPDGSSAFDGQIDDVRIYARALSPAEVQALFDATR